MKSVGRFRALFQRERDVMDDIARFTMHSMNLYDGIIPFQIQGQRIPTLDVYIPEKSVNTRYAMLAFPGGSYSFLSPKSGEQYGRWFASRGIAVIVVNFRLGPEDSDGLAICCDAMQAVSVVSANSQRWNIDKSKLGVIGTSAGGHLAGMLSTNCAENLLSKHKVGIPFDLQWRPEFAVYCYAVLSLSGSNAHIETRENFLGTNALYPASQFACSPIDHVNAGMCRSFIWHTYEDTEVTVSNSLEYAMKLNTFGNEVELHLYQKGPHALGLARNLSHIAPYAWGVECARWIGDKPVYEQA